MFGRAACSRLAVRTVRLPTMSFVPVAPKLALAVPAALRLRPHAKCARPGLSVHPVTVGPPPGERAGLVCSALPGRMVTG